MDDFVVWGEDRGCARGHRDRVAEFLKRRAVTWSLKPDPYINRCRARDGFPGLPGLSRVTSTLNRRSRVRFRRKLVRSRAPIVAGRIDEPAIAAAAHGPGRLHADAGLIELALSAGVLESMRGGRSKASTG